MAGLTTENLNYKIPRNLRDVYSGVIGPNLTLAQLLMMQTISAYRVADAVAGTDYVFAFFRADFDGYIVGARIIPHAALTANDTNYSTLTIQTVEGTPDVKATLTTQITGGSGDWVLNTPEELTVGDTGFSDGDVLALASTKTASGVAVPAGIIQLDIVPR